MLKKPSPKQIELEFVSIEELNDPKPNEKALEKLKGSKKQYKVLSPAELDNLARIKR